MKPFGPPVSLHETSMRINVFHKILKVLGFPVSEKEERSHTAGESTLRQVRAFQEKYNIKYDEAYVVDEATYDVLLGEMIKKGYADKSSSFVVKGTVYNMKGKVVKNQKLIALDVDLRGAAIFRSVKTIKEILDSGGFEFLRERYSDEQGDYFIEFYSIQYEKNERKTADIIVYAINKEGEILGRSRIVNSAEYSAKGEVRGLDVLIIKIDERTEYDILMDKLLPFLKESEVSLAELSVSADQVKFCSSELDEPGSRIQIAAVAESLRSGTGDRRNERETLSHELLYGIGRQDIGLDWLVLFKKTDKELSSAISRSVNQRIIKGYDERQITAFLKLLHQYAAANALTQEGSNKEPSLEKILSLALPDKNQQQAFLTAYRDFKTNVSEEENIDYKKFWREYLPQVKEFKQSPGAIDRLLLTQQLSILSGDHQPLIEELLSNRKISSPAELIALDEGQWKEIILKTGVPDFVVAEKQEDRVDAYISQLQTFLNVAYPTQKIASMLKKRELLLQDASVTNAINGFFAQNDKFDIGSSCVHEYEEEIKLAARDQYENVKKELNRLQRIFQVSPTPRVMGVLMEKNLNSAYAIASTPKKSFIKMHGNDLGGELIAEATYQRASYISALAAERAMKMYDLSHSAAPGLAYSKSDHEAVMTILQNQVSKRHNPNYSEIFGSPDICECEHCRSVYGPAAYFVDLLRFLWRGDVNGDGKSPLDMFNVRRPDLLHLPLTCENTNTIIPYIDLVNEVMEYYTYHNQLDDGAAYDTGDTTADELRANPQNFEREAYRILKNNVYPFSLPYHQPLDVIRTYSDHLKTERYEVMRAMQKDFSSVANKAIESEALRISEEEYRVLTLKNFSGQPDLNDLSAANPKPVRQLHDYFGFANNADLEKMAGFGVVDGIHEFLRRAGMKYTDLVELVKTKFINPGQHILEFLERLFLNSTMTATTIYTRLQQINANTLDPSTDAGIMAAITGKMSPADFKAWVQKNFNDFNAVITLYQSDSLCDLNTTYLKTIQNVYAALASSGLSGTPDRWSKIHRFIRLWRKLGWKLHEVDLMLSALGQTDITDTTISQHSYVVLLNRQLRLPLNQLATLWGSIDEYGDKSLYKKLFLNKAVQRIDEAFQPDKFGEYLTDSTLVLKDHIPAILAAFRMSEDDLSAVIKVARIKDNAVERALDLSIDKLNIYNLSVIYRYKVFSKQLKLKVPDFCLLTELYGASPFSILSVPAPSVPPVDPVFENISPSFTLDFYEWAASVKKAGFKAVMLGYIFNGKLPAESTIGLNEEKTKQVAPDIRKVFAAIEQDYPDILSAPLTPEILNRNLSLSFRPEVVRELIGIITSRQTFDILTEPGLPVVIPPALVAKYNYVSISGKLSCVGIMPDADRITLKTLTGANDNFKTAVDALYIQSKTLVTDAPAYSLITDANLSVVIPDSLSPKFTYTKASGRLSCIGIMSDGEQTALKALAGANANFQSAVDMIYRMPENFIRENFSGVFAVANSILPNADLITLLNHPMQPVEKTLDERLQFVYTAYLPLLKQKLREDAIIQHIASLVGLSDEATTVLIKNDLQSLITSIALEGFSAEYFANPTLTLPSALQRTDKEINFDWGATAAAPTVPADNFSVRWKSYISPPSTAEYTLIVEVKEANEAFSLFLDDALILQKTTANLQTSWEVIAPLNASKLHKLSLEYSESVGNAGITLSWKTATSGVQIIPASSSFPAEVIDSLIKLAQTFHRAAKFISGFKMTDSEINHFVNYKQDFGNIDFKAITLEHWKRISDYVQLRNAIPQSQALLTDIFVAANILDPTPQINSLIDKLYLATGWDTNTTLYLATTHFNLTPAEFKNEVKLLKIYKAVSFVLKTGLSVETLADWSKVQTGFDDLISTADLVKSTVKAKYEEEDWLKLAGDLSDKIRENQKQSLISYLLHHPNLIDWGVKDADGLFEYFLIDVQMGACMDTSRIVQATAAVQMFVNRCLLNMESKKVSASEKGVSPSAVDQDRWESMRYYRVWEVTKKIFVNPENWLEPEWRDDRSPFFKELESELTQNDINDRSVEAAFRNYLTKLNTVANLDVCCMYQESYGRGDFKMFHVFGRTHNAPYQFFYRTCNEFFKWSAWEKVQVDIRMTENGNDSGVHLIPVVWKNRLFIFWTEFLEKQKEKTVKTKGNSEATLKDISDQPPSAIKSIPYWEIRLAWSEYVDGKWSTKQLTKEYITQDKIVSEPIHLFTYRTTINSNNGLSISMHNPDGDFLGSFYLSDIQSPVVVNNTPLYPAGLKKLNYANFYMKHKKNAVLKFRGNTYLQNGVDHKILYSPQLRDFESTLVSPFFYHDVNRTYFVRPVSIKIQDRFKNPDSFGSPIVEKVDDSYFTTPHIPSVGPDDYMPGIEYADSLPQSVMEVLGFEMPAATGVMRTLSRENSPRSNVITFASEDMNGLMSDNVSGFILLSKSNDTGVTNEAFGGTKSIQPSRKYKDFHWDKGLKFHTFYHPYSSEFVTNLNQDGIKGLMDSDTLLKPSNQIFYNDSGSVFVSNYAPNFYQNLVFKAPVLNDYKAGEAYTFYKENICFDVYGANSMYNWELFFHAPLYIATRLSKNGKYEEAMKWFHYIFDPTTDEMPLGGQSETSRYWKTLPFKTTPSKSLEAWFMSLGPSGTVEEQTIAEWRKNPFSPFSIARNRPIAFMKNVVIKYVENLREWGDSLFRIFTRETVNEALQLYVMASHILGPRPEFVPKRGDIKAETYYSLKDKWDDFSNALVELENIFPYSGSASVSNGSGGPALLGIGKALYFCIPPNEKLMEHWDVVADRLYKIRHCMDIEGVERHLALFSPPIDPAMLINAAAQGLSLGSILSDLSSPPPIYRFSYLIQRASDFCNEVKSLGNSLLAALEKKDSEELGRLRASHETAMLELMTGIKERQLLDAKAGKESLLKSRESAAFRLQHYNAKLSEEAIALPPPPTIDANLNAESQLPVDTSIAEIKTDVDEALVDSDEAGIKLIQKEKEDLDKSEDAKWWMTGAGMAETLAGVLHLFPQLDAEGTPFGVGAGAWWGGQNIGAATSAVASGLRLTGQHLSAEASQASKLASYIRREQEWTLQANLAIKEIIQLDKQITSADIKIQVAEKELSNHKQQIENSKQVEQFLKDKFTGQELYQWMKEQVFSVYKQSYNMAYDMAKKVEKCYRYELGKEITNFIQYGYWDNTMQGLCAGEKLQLALRQMEKSFIEENKRDLELTKNVSIAMLNPLALQELRTSGKCFFAIPEEFYDLDYPGHYFRKIKSVSISLPCIAGPFTTVNCTLRLLKNAVRINTSMNDDGGYEHNNDEGMWIDDDRFRENNVPVKAIATSSGQRDSGMFELNFHDERYLPFEGAGAISEWKIELTRDVDLRQFDYATIADVILHINYSAREDAGLFKENAVVYLKSFLTNAAELSKQPLIRMFSMKHEFSTEWHKFLHPAVPDADQLLVVTLQKEHFPFFTKQRTINVKKMEVLLKANRTGDYKIVFDAADTDDNPMSTAELSMPENATYANMQKVTLTTATPGMNIEDLNVFVPMKFKFRHSTDVSVPQKYNTIDTDPEEIGDIFVAMHYSLGDEV